MDLCHNHKCLYMREYGVAKHIILIDSNYSIYTLFLKVCKSIYIWIMDNG